MPLTVAMPCGFEENLMDFECSGGVAGSWGASSHTVTDFDHPDPLLMVSLSNKEQLNCANDGIGAIAGATFTITVTLPSFCDEIEPFTESGWRAIRFFPPLCPRFRGNETKGGSKMATAT
ncbi:hypothetical protein OUZ56_006552 [Daphnia magna]|uniref:Uncharacterized protein n=1 Tax=Daphnia magna TaxID=35525 RepID=A0ABQ9YVZ0_9CRUS|nr:hypothetical protein OUZ56_006552 [Daphnia magna]